MSKRTLDRYANNADHTSLEVEGQHGRLSLAGPALAVIAIVALIGMIVVCVKLIDMSERAIVSKTPSAQVAP